MVADSARPDKEREDNAMVHLSNVLNIFTCTKSRFVNTPPTPLLGNQSPKLTQAVHTECNIQYKLVCPHLFGPK